MSFFKAKQLGFLALGITGLALVAAQGCSSDDTQAAPPTAGSAGKTAVAGSTGSEAGDTNSNGGTGNVSGGGSDNAGAGGVAGEAGAGGEGGAPVVNPSCIGSQVVVTGTTADCYLCAPTTSSQFENACVTGGCPAHFDNSTLTKINMVGTL